MLKNIAKLEVQMGEKTYQLLCDNDSPLEHLKEALFQFQKYVGQCEDNAKAQIASQEAAKNNEETPSTEVDNVST